MQIAYRLETAPFSKALIRELTALSFEVFGPGNWSDLAWRLDKMPDATCFEARSAEKLIGFKLGYAATSRRYYSWLGGVSSNFRRLGVASELMRRQHDWIEAQGYSVVETAAVQNNHDMARLNTGSGFVASGILFSGDNPKIVYSKVFGGDSE